MALYNITAQTSVLKITLDTSGNDVQTKEQTFNAPSIVLRADKIRFYESGNYRTELTFTTIGEIDGETPTDIQDAANKINNLISANFNSGGATPQSLEQVLNVSDRPVILHDVTSGDFTFDTTHIGKYIGFYGEGICNAVIPDNTYDPAIWVNLVGGVSENCTVNFKWQANSKSLLVGGNPTKVISFSAKLTDPEYNGWVWSVSTDELTGGEPSGKKRAVYKVTSQSSGGLVLQEISNNTGISFTFTRIDVGLFDIPEFDTNNYSLDGKTCNTGMDCFFSNEDQKLTTYDYRNSQLSDDAFEFGGWIVIEKLT